MPAHHRPRPSAEVYQLRRTVAALVVVSVLVLAAWGGASLFRADGPAATTTSAPAPTTTSTVATTTTTSDPGVLPQTDQEPPIQGALLARLAPLWQAIVANDPALGASTFFPRSAYLAMKTGRIEDPPADYDGRLRAFYELDVAAYHEALKARPGAELVAVNANPAYAHFVPVGECENGVGYWHLPGVRMVYANPSGKASFAVASLISWRGVWYVVHLGPNPRPSDVGTVAQPAEGPGTPGPPGGC